jgi:hypothetical protein
MAGQWHRTIVVREYTFSNCKGNGNHELGTGLWNHAHALNVRVDLEKSVAALDGMKS